MSALKLKNKDEWSMRRRAALAVAVLVASVPVAAAPAAAQAGTPDPASALKRRLEPERGVRISETSRTYFGAASKSSGNGTRISGKVQLSPAGPVATDFTWWTLSGPKAERPPSERSAPYRVIRVGKGFYDSADRYPGPVPDGKKWVRFPGKHKGSSGRDMARDASLQPIDVYDPSAVKAMVKRSTSKPVSGGYVYRGSVSYKELSKVFKGPFINWASGRPITAKTTGKISWRLWTDRKGLLKRLVTSDAVGAGKEPLLKQTDTRYTAWGFRLVVSAPPADEVIDEADLLEYIREQNEPIPTDAGNF
ncbi:hypothetical protein SAMN05421505_14231 [Sinosporangium album]|uniref:Uncharacterized protein n=1 Tax=Sinosporangium album TaxID=504805 RepID=A0A1G8JBX9_9ACTN|nr:hypothetical protein [Sinosporangium album]SDI28591.1 hypothetical protein SAMN05421505_14231 [Sinosporangium album]